jgi:hypothetical protein
MGTLHWKYCHLLLIHVHLFDQDNHNALLNITEWSQAGSGTNASDLYYGGARFESRPRHRNPGSFSGFSIESPWKQARNTSYKLNFFPHSWKFIIRYHEIISVTDVIVKPHINRAIDKNLVHDVSVKPITSTIYLISDLVEVFHNNSYIIYLSICLSTHPSVRPSVHPSIHPSIHLSIYLSMALQSFLLDFGHFFSFLILYTVGRTP